jgi:hypothetical protein
MSRRSRVLVAGWVITGSVLGVQLADASPAAKPHHLANTIAPAKVAWFDQARATSAVPATPMAGVGKGDLLVSGVTVNLGQVPLVPVPGSVPVLQRVIAFAAFDFTIPKGATPATLALKLSGLTTAKIDSHLPSGVTPVACPTTSKWKAGDEQSIADAPTYNCKTLSSIGQLGADGKSVTFPGINRLIRGRTLSFVVLPGTLGPDRLVFSKPGPRTLSLLRFGSPPSTVASLPPVPTSSPTTPTTTVVPPVQSGGGVGVPVPSEPAISSAPDRGGSPQIAPNGITTAVLPVAASSLDKHHARLAAVALLVALVVTTLWLAVTDSSGGTFATLRVLRALSSGGPLPDLPATEWGVGRFRAPRDGRPPSI